MALGAGAIAVDLYSNEVVVAYQSGVAAEAAGQMHATGFGAVRGFDPTLNAVKIALPKRVNPVRYAALLSRSSLVRYAEPNFLVRTARIPPDPMLLEGQYGPALIRATEAWPQFVPRRQVVVAVVDTGVSYTHTDLRDMFFRVNGIVVGRDFANNDADASDDQGHGTHCAGILAARSGNGVGIAGVAGFPGATNTSPGIRLMPVKVLDSQGRGGTSTVAAGIIWAVRSGARVISLSLGSTSNSNALRDAVQFALDNNAVVVAAAGNSGNSTQFFPAAYDPVISVASVGPTGRLSSFSNFGTWVDVAAPGDGILSTLSSGNFGYMSGTSMATPHVAGQAALLMSHSPRLTAENVRNLIQGNTAQVITGANRPVRFGRVDVRMALDAASAQSRPTLAALAPSTSAIASGSRLRLAIRLTSPAPASGVRVGLHASPLHPGFPQKLTIPGGTQAVTHEFTTASISAARTYVFTLAHGLERMETLVTIRPTESPSMAARSTMNSGSIAHDAIRISASAKDSGLRMGLQAFEP